MLCGEQHPALLGCGDAVGRVAVAPWATQPDFDEDDGVPVSAHQIDFAAAAADVACQHMQAVRFQMRSGKRFGGGSTSLRAACGGVDNGVSAARKEFHRVPFAVRLSLPSFRLMSASVALPAQVLSSTPSLYVVATPIGNLHDIGLRSLALLAAVDLIAAEDTRHSQRLLDAYGIRTRLFAAHRHNEHEAADRVIARLDEGAQVALISDAGTPAISDPGARLVARVRAAGHPVVPVPGPCAAVAALSVAGLAEGGFRFVGFLPATGAARATALAALAGETAPMVFYEAPHRVLDCVTDLLAAFGGERQLLVARELSKLHEQIARMPLDSALAWFAADANRCRGEFVLVVDGCPADEGLTAEAERVLALLLAELPVKTAARLAATITGASKNALYARALQLKQDGDGGGERL